jgi:hypothetical protein
MFVYYYASFCEEIFAYLKIIYCLPNNTQIIFFRHAKKNITDDKLMHNFFLTQTQKRKEKLNDQIWKMKSFKKSLYLSYPSQ